MDSFEILWDVKYKELAKYKWCEWFTRFKSPFAHSRWYTFRGKVINRPNLDVCYVRYYVEKDRKWAMRNNFQNRID